MATMATAATARHEGQPARIPRPLYLLVASAFLMNAGQFMVLPFLALYLTGTVRETPWQVGTVLSANLLCARVLPLAMGLLGDRTSHGATIVAGAVTRGLGFLAFAMAHQFAATVGASALVGLGTALYTPSVKAIFATQPEAWRVRVFTLFNQALNLGAVAGPLLGSLALLAGATRPFVWGGVLFLTLAAALFIARCAYQAAPARTPLRTSLGRVLAHRPFMAFTGASVLFWILYAQLTLSLPLIAYRLGHMQAAVSALFVVNGLSGAVLMIWLRRAFATQRPLALVRAGLLLVGVGRALVPVVPAMAWLLACVVVYTLGETLVFPASDMAVAAYSESAPADAGAFFGLFSLSWALGGTVGNYLGAWLMARGGPVWPWLIYGGIAALGILALSVVDRRGTASIARGPHAPHAPAGIG